MDEHNSGAFYTHAEIFSGINTFCGYFIIQIYFIYYEQFWIYYYQTC